MKPSDADLLSFFLPRRDWTAFRAAGNFLLVLFFFFFSSNGAPLQYNLFKKKKSIDFSDRFFIAANRSPTSSQTLQFVSRSLCVSASVSVWSAATNKFHFVMRFSERMIKERAISGRFQ